MIVIKVVIPQKTKQVLKFFEELPKRFEALERTIIHDLAHTTLNEVRERIPVRDQVLKRYADSLHVAQVTGHRAAWVVYAQLSRQRTPEQKENIVFYVRPHKKVLSRRGTSQPAKYVSVLTEYSPWTADTLPVYPSARDALIYQRQVSLREYNFVRERRIKERMRWGAKLARFGVRLSRLPKAPRDVTFIDDVAFTAKRLEFGGGDQRDVPHWRPTLRSFQPFWRYFRQQRKWLNILSVKNRSWCKTYNDARVSGVSLRQYKAFQDMLLPRI